MRRRSGLHILVLETVLDTGNNFSEIKIWKLLDGFYTRSPTKLIDPASNIATLKLAQKDTNLTTKMLLLPCLTEASYKTISCADRLRGQCRTKCSACLRGHQHHSPTV